MDITQKIRDVMEKVEPWQWVAGLGVAGLGIYAYVTSDKSGGYTDVPLSKVQNLSGDGGGDSSGSESGIIETIAENMENQGESFTQAFNSLTGSITNSNLIVTNAMTKVNEGYSDLNSQVVSLAAVVKENTKPIGTIIPVSLGESAVKETPALKPSVTTYTPPVSGNYGNNGVGYNPETTKQYNQVLQTVPSAYIAEVKRVESVIANRKAAGMDTTAQVNYAKSIQSFAPVNLGNNGIGYDPEKSKAFEKSLQTNSSAMGTELVRVNTVIANRKAAGMDISAQTAYLKKLTGKAG